MLEAEESPKTAKEDIDHAHTEVELGDQPNTTDMQMPLTLILGYSDAGSSPSKTLRKRTTPEYSACVAACLSTKVERGWTSVTGTTPDVMSTRRPQVLEQRTDTVVPGLADRVLDRLGVVRHAFVLVRPDDQGGMQASTDNVVQRVFCRLESILRLGGLEVSVIIAARADFDLAGLTDFRCRFRARRDKLLVLGIVLGSGS